MLLLVPAMLGTQELVIIFAILLLIFGASRLPRLGEAIGKSIRGLKRGMNVDDDIEVTKQVTGESSAQPVKKEAATDAEISRD